MTRQPDGSIAYSRDVIEFATVAVRFCAHIEATDGAQPREWRLTMVRLLPLLYLKATLLPALDESDEVSLEETVSEADYEAVRSEVARVMGEKDDYLDVFVEEMKYSDTPILQTVSESLADVYQMVKNFCGVYARGVEADMLEAVAETSQSFRTYWGQRLLGALRALHDTIINETAEDEAWQ